MENNKKTDKSLQAIILRSLLDFVGCMQGSRCNVEKDKASPGCSHVWPPCVALIEI